MTPAEIIALIQLAEMLAKKGVNAYGHMRELAAKNGISEEDLAAADARYGKVYTDPLGGGGGTLTIPDGPEPFPYDVNLEAFPATAGKFDDRLKPGDRIFQKPNGKFNVVPSGVGINIPADWKLLNTVGDPDDVTGG